jgi:hypothetical protein
LESESLVTAGKSSDGDNTTSGIGGFKLVFDEFVSRKFEIVMSKSLVASVQSAK